MDNKIVLNVIVHNDRGEVIENITNYVTEPEFAEINRRSSIRYRGNQAYSSISYDVCDNRWTQALEVISS